MRRRRSRQGPEIVTAFQHRNKPALGVAHGGFGKALGHPAKVIFFQFQSIINTDWF